MTQWNLLGRTFRLVFLFTVLIFNLYTFISDVFPDTACKKKSVWHRCVVSDVHSAVLTFALCMQSFIMSECLGSFADFTRNLRIRI